MKLLTSWLCALAMLCLCGCFQLQDELVLEPDGSGKVTITVQSSLPDELTAMMGSRFGGNSEPFYPPVNENEARQFFPPKSFVLKIDSHQLTLTTNANGALNLQALTGASILAQAAQFKAEGELAALEIPGLEDAQKKKNGLRVEFRVTLPNAVSAANGTRNNKSVTWTVERAACTNDDQFATRLGEVLQAACPADGLKFTPLTPPRLGLLPFGQLAAGKSASSIPVPDTNKVVAAARFVPCLLHVTRALDLSGEGHGFGSQAQLVGAVLVPPDLAPQRWGEPRLEEVTDAKGNNLMPKDDDPGSSMTRRMRYGRYTPEFEEGDDPDETPEGQAKTKSAEKPHMITLGFKAPEWKVKQIARIKGDVALNYLGGSEIVKLSNAVPASLVMDPTKRSFSSGLDSDRGQIVDSQLAALGLSVQVQMAMAQAGFTMLSLRTSGTNAALVDAQVFDSDGLPWPTSLMQSESDGEDRSCQLIVAGKPKPPFSLALAVGGVAASAVVPFLLENVPVADK
jgi:hypothetical protein